MQLGSSETNIWNKMGWWNQLGFGGTYLKIVDLQVIKGPFGHQIGVNPRT